MSKGDLIRSNRSF